MKARKKIEPTPYSVTNAERLAKIMGEQSATAIALRELRKRQADGEDVSMFIVGSWIFVGPTGTGSVT
jgi:hypothetical protein